MTTFKDITGAAVDAVQWLGGRPAATPRWVRVAFAAGLLYPRLDILQVLTPSGRKLAGAGDWIIRRAAGEYDAVPPAVFEQTFTAL